MPVGSHVAKKRPVAAGDDEASVGGDDGAEARRAAKRARKEAKQAARLAAAQVEQAEADTAPEEEEQPPPQLPPPSTTTAPTASNNGTKKRNAAGTTEAHRKANNITVEGEDGDSSVFEPVLSFDTAPFDADMLQYCAKYTKPSPIQSQCWPITAAGRDIVGVAATGSGKTLAFALPGVSHIRQQQQQQQQQNKKNKGGRSGPVMLVLAPTRELACQIDAVCSELCKIVRMSSVCIYGGVGKDQQRQALQRGAQIVVATPGRLLDLIDEGVCSLDRISFLVLDEADRMLDLGFEQDIRTIIGKVKKQRQTLMFSATWPVSIQTLAHEFLQQPIKVVVGSQDLAASHSVKQIVEVLEHTQKEDRLNQLLRDYHKTRKNRVLVFVLYKKEAERVERFLRSKGWDPGSIHGDKNQQDRTAALQSFKDGSRPLLIATDVAARGLDIPNVEYVINLTFPLTIEDYVHRIGRTGRAGATGVSHTLFTVYDKSHAGELVNVLKEAKQPVPENLLKFGTHTKKKEHKLYGAHFKPIEDGEVKKATKITFDDDDDE